MNQCKITVLRTECYQDLIEEYGVPGLGPCPVLKVGDTFICGIDQPQGFCADAWRAVHPFVFALCQFDEESRFFGGRWVREPGVAIITCADGLRPIVMKVERYKDD